MTDAQNQIIGLLKEIKAAAGGGAAAVWGAITGTLSNQTDLQTQLDGKASLAQAAHSGGVIGTAIITITGGDTVASVVNATGVLSNVVGGYSFNAGVIQVTFPVAQPDGFYIPQAIVESSVPCMNKTGAPDATAFIIEFHDKNGSPITTEIDKIRIIVSRLSQ